MGLSIRTASLGLLLGFLAESTLAFAGGAGRVRVQTHPTRMNHCSIKGLVALGDDGQRECACLSFGQVSREVSAGAFRARPNPVLCANSESRAVRDMAQDTFEGQEPMPLAEVLRLQ